MKEDEVFCWRWCAAIELPRLPGSPYRRWFDFWEWLPEGCVAEGW